MNSIHLKGDFATETLGEIEALFGQNTILIADAITGVAITHSIDTGHTTTKELGFKTSRRDTFTPVNLNEVSQRNTRHMEVENHVRIAERGWRTTPK